MLEVVVVVWEQECFGVGGAEKEVGAIGFGVVETREEAATTRYEVSSI